MIIKINRITKLLSIAVAMVIALPAIALAQSSITVSEPENVTVEHAPGQQINPAMIEYQGKPYLFWSSNTDSMGQEYDILYSTMENGVWGEVEVLTQDIGGNDHVPMPIVYNDYLYLFWSSDNSEVTGGGGTDIVFSKFEGTVWSSPESLTDDFNEMGDYNPWPVIYNSKLYVFFQWYSQDSGHYEIAFLHNEDYLWPTVIEVTARSSGHNLNPTAAVNGDELILAWESSDETLTGQDAESAIITRSMASGTWNNYSSLTVNAGPYNHDPCAITYEGSTWIFWSTNSQAISLGDDFDIVGRRCSDGNWDSNVHEISSGGSGDDTGPSATLFGKNLAVSWISSSQEFSAGEDTDVVLSLFDGESWSVPIDISQEDDGKDDAGGFTYKCPALLESDGELLVLWETNASPSVVSISDTWLMMVVLDSPTEKDNTIYWLALISFVCIGIATIGLLKFNKK